MEPEKHSLQVEYEGCVIILKKVRILMEKKVITNFKYIQDFKMNESYDKDLRFKQFTSRAIVRMDGCCKG